MKFGFPQWELVQFCFPILKVFRELVVSHFPTSGNPLNFFVFLLQIIGKMGKWECYRTPWSTGVENDANEEEDAIDDYTWLTGELVCIVGVHAVFTIKFLFFRLAQILLDSKRKN